MNVNSASTDSLHSRDQAGSVAVPASTLQRQLLQHLTLASLTLLAAGLGLFTLYVRSSDAPALLLMLLTMSGLWASICVLLWRGLPEHGQQRFGPANTLTLYRAAGAVLLAGWIPAASTLPPSWFWYLSLAAVFLLALDGLDGYLARRSGLASALGARFDMETDALLTLIVSILLWQTGEVGPWILTLGLMRYAFVLAGARVKALRKPLFPSFRRKLICVVQLASLCLILSPLVSAPWSTLLGLVACLLLSASFARDAHWLLTTRT